MWNRKELKEKARQTVRKNYWPIVAVSFILMIFIGSVSSWDWMMGENDEVENEPNLADSTAVGGKSSADVLKDFILDTTGIDISEKITGKQGVIDDTVGAAVSGAVSGSLTGGSVEKSTFTRLIHSISSIIENDYLSFVLSLTGMILGLLFSIFFCNVLEVGGSRFFLETRKYEDTQIRRLFFAFINKRWKNTAWIMFCRNFFTGLWMLTIVGGIIKIYEYAMISYIVAENPHIDRREAFALSKQMMKGNKWKLFVLQLSFIGWYLLNMLTLGLLEIFYTAPYFNSTMAELYMSLRNEAIDSKYTYYEALNDAYL